MDGVISTQSAIALNTTYYKNLEWGDNMKIKCKKCNNSSDIFVYSTLFDGSFICHHCGCENKLQDTKLAKILYCIYEIILLSIAIAVTFNYRSNTIIRCILLFIVLAVLVAVSYPVFIRLIMKIRKNR